MEAASSSDLKAASEQGTILLIKYKGAWYGNGTVGDAAKPVDTNSTTYTSGWAAGWAAAMASLTASSSSSSSSEESSSSSGYGEESSSSGYGDSAEVVSYSAAGGAALLLCGFALVTAYRKVTRRRIALAAGEGSNPLSPRNAIV